MLSTAQSVRLKSHVYILILYVVFIWQTEALNHFWPHRERLIISSNNKDLCNLICCLQGGSVRRKSTKHQSTECGPSASFLSLCRRHVETDLEDNSQIKLYIPQPARSASANICLNPKTTTHTHCFCSIQWTEWSGSAMLHVFQLNGAELV